jgi:hypothetical protein
VSEERERAGQLEFVVYIFGDGFHCWFVASIGGDENCSDLHRRFKPINSDENEFHHQFYYKLVVIYFHIGFNRTRAENVVRKKHFYCSVGTCQVSCSQGRLWGVDPHVEFPIDKD